MQRRKILHESLAGAAIMCTKTLPILEVLTMGSNELELIIQFLLKLENRAKITFFAFIVVSNVRPSFHAVPADEDAAIMTE